nr:MAG TPA: hypothetical protein [Caudoviricetes sp.]
MESLPNKGLSLLKRCLQTDLESLRKVSPTRYFFLHCPLLARICLFHSKHQQTASSDERRFGLLLTTELIKDKYCLF